MKKQTDKEVYGIYYRKSSESEDRQAQSIPDQIRDTEALVHREKLIVGKRYPGESQSAHSPGRPVFAELINDINAGKINSVLVWHANRLARNPVDAGSLLYLMDIGRLKVIRTPHKVYRNNANDKFLLQLEFGMSKKDSDDKSEVVKRALQGRAKRGLPNGVAHIGYINDQTKEKGNRGWIKDPVRYPLVKQILTMMLSGKYTVRQLHKYAKEELKLTTPQRRKQGGMPIALSYMYTLLKDPIHAGFFFQDTDGEQERYAFNTFEPMITEEEYWKIQSMLGSKGRPRMTKRQATYNHFARCGTCNGILSPDFKFQVICSGCKKKFSHLNRSDCPSCGLAIEKMKSPTFLSYVFYYCINDKKHRTKCPRNGIEEKNLERQIIDDLHHNLAISKELSAWCINNIGSLKDQAIEDAINQQKNLEQEKIAIEGKIKRLTMLRISTDHTADENANFDRIEKELRDEASLIDLKLSNTNVDWFKEASRDFDLMSEVVKIIGFGTPEQKKDVLHAFGSNLMIADKKLTIINKKSIDAFKTYLRQAKDHNKAFEPEFCEADKDKTEVFASVCPNLLRG
jgi:site-specific DNA recombinase